MDFIIGGIAGSGATIFSNPIDVIKTRLQLQGELKSKAEQTVHYRGIAHGLYTVAKNDGIMALQRGLAPAMIYGFFMNGIRLGLYKKADSDGWTRNHQGEIMPMYAMLCAGMCGVCGSCVCNPFSIVKIRLHSRASKNIAVGKQHQYRGIWDAFTSIYKTEGIRGYYRGVNAGVMRLGLGSAAQLSAFSIAKDELQGNGIIPSNKLFLLSFVASMISGIIVAVVTCPLDVVSTRLFNQGRGKDRMYHGIFDCFKKIARTEGLYGFYKGLMPLYFRLAPHTTVSLIIWDRLNYILSK